MHTTSCCLRAKKCLEHLTTVQNFHFKSSIWSKSQLKYPCAMELSRRSCHEDYPFTHSHWKNWATDRELQQECVPNTLHCTDTALAQHVWNFTFLKSFSSSLHWLYKYLHTTFKKPRRFLPRKHVCLLSGCTFRFQMPWQIAAYRRPVSRPKHITCFKLQRTSF